MILLNGRSLTPVRKVPAEALSLQLKERESTATMTPADMTGIAINSWLKDETEPGAGIVWRVRSIGQAFVTKTPTVQLEHAISTLKDVILFGEHKPAQIAGNKNATTCTAEQTIRYILSRQSDWTLGSFGYAGVTNPYKFNGDTLFEALETVTASLADAWWSYDMSVYPFRLNITQKKAGVGSEMRAGRNLKTITKNIDKSGMFTRFYPIGADDLHIDGDYVEKNVSLYGVVSKVETDQSIDTKAELVRWANERLRDHAEPTVTIDVEGVELADATGESMDRLKLGEYCRVPLPEFGTTITERIVSLNYSDKIHQPQVVKVQLANNRQDVTKIISDALKRGGKGGRTGAKKAKEDLAWFEDTNEHVAMCAKGIIGVDAAGNPNWVRLSQIYVDGTGIAQTVSSIQNDVVITQSELKQQEDSIGMIVRKQDSRPVSTVPKMDYLPATGDPNKLYYVIETSRYYEWKNGKYVIADPKKMIDAGSIVLAINDNGGSEATINANKVTIGELNNEDLDTWAKDAKNGEGVFTKFLTVRKLSAQEVTTLLANIGSADINVLDVGDLYCDQLVVDGDMGMDSIYLNPIGDFIRKAEVTGTQLKLYPVNGDPITFSKATSLGGQWSGNTLTVTATPQGNTYQSAITTGFVTGTASDPPAGYFITAYHADQGAQAPSEIRSARVQIQLGVLENSKNVIRVLNAAGTGFINGSPMLTIPTLVAENIKEGVDILGIIGTYGGPSPGYEAPYGTPIGSTIVTSGSIVSNGVSSAFSLARETMRPQGSTVDIQAVKLTLGSDVIGRIDVPLEVCTVDGVGPFTPSAGKVGFSQVNVDTTNLTAGNIKSGVTILGVTGSYVPAYETPHGTAIGSNVIVASGNVTANGKSAAFTLTNETMRPQGQSQDIKAVKLTLGGTVIGRAEVTKATPVITGVAVSDDSNDHNPGTINVAGIGVTSTDQKLTITNGSWSNGKMATNIRFGTSSGTLIARKWLYMPQPTESCTNPAAYNFRITASCGGKSVTYLLKTNSTGGKVSFAKV